jgi:uncharacterized protein (TIGR02145 family)
MKVFHYLPKNIGSFAIFSILLTACVNHISEENEAIIADGNIPLKFVTDIHELTNTRIVGNSFEEGEGVGLFALAGSTTMQEERYVDNLHFVRSSGGEFLSDELVYYPDDGVTLNLVSYYPYRQEGVAIGESTMSVSVETNQEVAADYSRSDFLVAIRDGVSASIDAIPLTYNHKFFRLKIAIVPGEGGNVEDLLAADPHLSVSGFYTKAIYDFQKQSYSDYSEENVIIPAGVWQIEAEKKLIGKELILIPQEVMAGYQYVTLEVEGKQYISLLPSTLNLQEGKQRELEITFVAAEDILMNKVSGEISDWKGDETDHAESENLHKYIDVSKLTFAKSNVYKVLNAGKQVAEICKEYLVTPDFSSQAIVAYPMKNDATADLSQGVVVQLLGQAGKVHGGKVSWNIDEHSLTYIAGTLPVYNNIYVLANGKVTLSITEADDVLQVLALDDVARDVRSVLALEDIVRDVRGGVIHNYPLVKIGTQYWMRNNLEVALFANGDEIPKLNEVTENAVGYLLSCTNNYLYTASVALSPDFLPLHWNIPNWEDWNILNSYLKGDVSLLKSGEWVSIDGAEVLPVNNDSGFNGLPVGMYSYPDLSVLEGKFLGYWTLDDTNTEMAESVFFLKSNANTMETATSAVERKAFSIRCIRK